MTAEESNPRTAIDRFLNNKLTGAQLLRILAAYKGWRVPARLESLVPSFNAFDLGHGETHFFLFSDKDAYQHCRDRIGTSVVGEYYIDNVSGQKAFAAVDEAVSVVNINPYSPQEIHYTREQLPRLKAWSAIIRTEQALETARTDRSSRETLRAFGGYFFIMEDDQYIALAPDGRGRKLAALFTADDALDLFLERNGKPNMKPVPIDGEKLFTAIRKMPLDGMVFNSSGPVKPCVFPLVFADEVLAG